MTDIITTAEYNHHRIAATNVLFSFFFWQVICIEG